MHSGPARTSERRQRNPYASLEQPERPASAPPAPEVRLNIWRVTDSLLRDFYIRCPSRSGAKIHAADRLGAKPLLTSALVGREEVPTDEIIHTAVFETVQEFAARIEQEKRSGSKTKA